MHEPLYLIDGDTKNGGTAVWQKRFHLSMQLFVSLPDSQILC